MKAKTVYETVFGLKGRTGSRPTAAQSSNRRPDHT